MEIYLGSAATPRLYATFKPGDIAGKVSCNECSGSGWWGFGPSEDTCGPCVDCKGTGLVWVGL